jgi:hypothetical protein
LFLSSSSGFTALRKPKRYTAAKEKESLQFCKLTSQINICFYKSSVMKKISLLFIAAYTLCCNNITAQQLPPEIPLYPNEIPNNIPGENKEKSVSDGILRISNVRIPTLRVFLPPKEKANGTAVVICPGGGYRIVAIGHEGYDVAKKFNEAGVAAVVLKYRLPDSAISPQPEIAPLQDAQQAILTVRQNAQKWNIDPNRVGIMGFSAGGHLASTAGTHFKKILVGYSGNLSARPDFMILGYPVISADTSISHRGSFNNLLGKNPSAEKLKEYSNELQVTPETPPHFLFIHQMTAPLNLITASVFTWPFYKIK